MIPLVIPAKITKNGTFTMPAKLRQLLEIGDSFLFEYDGNDLKIKTRKKTLQQVFQSVPALKKSLTDQEIKEIIVDEIAEKNMRILSQSK